MKKILGLMALCLAVVFIAPVHAATMATDSIGLSLAVEGSYSLVAGADVSWTGAVIGDTLISLGMETSDITTTCEGGGVYSVIPVYDGIFTGAGTGLTFDLRYPSGGLGTTDFGGNEGGAWPTDTALEIIAPGSGEGDCDGTVYVTAVGFRVPSGVPGGSAAGAYSGTVTFNLDM